MPTFQPFFSLPANSKSRYGFHNLKPKLKQFFDEAFQEFDACRERLLSDSYSDQADLKMRFDSVVGEAKAKNSLNDEYWNDIQQIEKSLLQNHHEVITFKAYQEHCQLFNNAEQWQQWKLAIHEKEAEKLEAMKSLWARQAKWAHCSADVLLYAHTLLEEIAMHYREAREEYDENHDHLPKRIANQYGAYLDKLYQTLKIEINTLHFAMLCRLQNTVNHQQPLLDDVITPVLHHLRSNGLVIPKTKYSLPAKPRQMQASSWCRLYDTLTRYAKPSLKEELSQIAYLKTDAPFSVQPFSYNQKSFFVPHQLAPLLPNTASLVTNLIWGDVQPDTIFEDKPALLLKVVNVARAEPIKKAATPVQNQSWDELLHLQQELINFYQESEKRKITRWPLRVIRNKANKLLEAIQGQLISQQRMVLQKQFDLLKQWLPVLPLAPIIEEPIFKPAIRNELIKKFLEIQNAAQALSFYLHTEAEIASHNTFKLALGELNDYFNDLMRQDDTLFKAQAEKSTAIKALLNIINGEEVEKNTINLIINYYKNLTLGKREAFRQEQASYLHHLQGELTEKLMQSMHSHSMAPTTAHRLMALHTLLKKIGVLTANIEWEKINSALTQYYNSHLSEPAEGIESPVVTVLGSILDKSLIQKKQDKLPQQSDLLSSPKILFQSSQLETCSSASADIDALLAKTNQNIAQAEICLQESNDLLAKTEKYIKGDALQVDALKKIADEILLPTCKNEQSEVSHEAEKALIQTTHPTETPTPAVGSNYIDITALLAQTNHLIRTSEALLQDEVSNKAVKQNDCEQEKGIFAGNSCTSPLPAINQDNLNATEADLINQECKRPPLSLIK